MVICVIIVAVKNKIALGCDSKIFRCGKNIDEIMSTALELGVNIFDTARGYGKSEETLGKYIRSHGNREDYFVITKGCLPALFSRLNPKELRKDIEKSLKTLDIGYIDLYLLHRDDKRCDFKEILNVLNEYVKKGKIKEYGLSNYRADRIEEINKLAKELGYQKIKSVSNNFTIIPWNKDPWGGGDGCVSVSDKISDLSYYKKENIINYSYSPLARGFLSGKIKYNNPSTFKYLDNASKKAYLSKDNLLRLEKLEQIAYRLNLDLASLSIAYICNISPKNIPIIGTISINRLKQNFAASQIILDDEILKEIREITLLR